MSNKDWDSGSNDGVVLFNSGSGLQWNFREVDDGINSNTRKDSGGTSIGLEDGTWQSLRGRLQPLSNAGTYVDGKLIHVDPLATPQGRPLAASLAPQLSTTIQPPIARARQLVRGTSAKMAADCTPRSEAAMMALTFGLRTRPSTIWACGGGV